MRRYPIAVLLAVLFFSGITLAQPVQPSRVPDKAKTLAAARTVIDKARYCALVTVDGDGHPQARIVDPFAPEDDMIVWIATNPSTRKVAQIRTDPRVTLLYFDSTTNSYVTLLGRAALVTDAAEKAKRWKPAWATLYKDANRGDDYLLIRVVPRRAEVLSPANGIMPDATTWRPVTIDLP